MTVIADISVPADAFEMGRVFVDFPTVEVELERVVPLQETIMPLFWVSGSDAAAIEAALDGNPHAKQLRQLTTTDEKTLFEVRWTDQGDGMVGAFIDTRARILEATGGAETWDFRLRFETHDQLAELAQEMDISDSARSQRMRRGLAGAV